MHTMKTRATITIDPSLHARAKRLAKQRRTSVSGLFETLIKEQPETQTSFVEQMLGSASLRSERTDDPRRAALRAKYLR
ncbi:MAG: DUF6364 family protein [Lentimonas sp.]